MNYTYLIRCADGSLYGGWTNDLEKRIAAHNAGQGAKYTKSRRPVKLVWWECFETKEEAMSREWHVKRLTRAQKEELVRGQTSAEMSGGVSGERKRAMETPAGKRNREKQNEQSVCDQRR